MRDDEAVDYQALAEFRYGLRKFLAFSETAAGGAGLTTQQHQALLVVKALGGERGVTVGLLSERLLIRQHSAVELVDRLERGGLVGRGSDPADKRRVLVSLTEDGESRLAALSAAHLEELRTIGPALAAILTGLQRKKSD